MFVKKLMALILGVILIKAISGASFSNVFVESETSPARYYPYSLPYGYTSVASPYYSQIRALSGSVPTYADPCVSPCVPGQTLTAVRPSANVVTYNSPYATVPVVVGTANEDTNGYQYSYVVYDENTGDHKAQRELSDGSVVHGEYSLIQPDGYVRKVQNVADDLKGFNAVVKNYVPIASGDTRQYEIKYNEHSPPCHDEKKASLIEPLAKGLNDHLDNNKHNQENNVSENNHEGELEQSQENINESKEKLIKTSSESIERIDDENFNEKHKQVPTKHFKEEEHWEKNNKKSNEESIEDSEDSVENSENKSKMSVESKKESNETSEENLKELYKKPKTESTESHVVTYKIKTKKVSKEKSSESESVEDSKEATKAHMKHEEVHGLVTSRPESESAEDSKEATKVHMKHEEAHGLVISPPESESVEDSKEATKIYIKHKEAHDLVMSPPKVFVPYYDIVRCLQASLKKSEGGPAALSQEPSFLTYLVLNKPC